MYLDIFAMRRARAGASAAVLAGLTAVLAWLTAVVVPGTPAAAAAGAVCVGAERIAVRFSSVSCTFGYTGTEQAFRVPAGVYSATVVAIGDAGGAGSIGGTGGEGEQVMANIPTRPHQTLRVEVGGNSTAASGGHGPGGASDVRHARSSAGPGGASDVRQSAPYAGGGGVSDVRRVSRLADGTPSTRLVIAAGGGGDGGRYGAAGGSGAASGMPHGGGGGSSGSAVRGIIVFDQGQTASPPSVTISFSEPGAPMVVTVPMT